MQSRVSIARFLISPNVFSLSMSLVYTIYIILYLDENRYVTMRTLSKEREGSDSRSARSSTRKRNSLIVILGISLLLKIDAGVISVLTVTNRLRFASFRL